jgi:glycosyltransferase involved in cell wall biosynthesis
LSLVPVALLAARLVSARVTLVAHGWEIIFSRRRLERFCGYRVDRVAANSRHTALEVERLFRKEGARRFASVDLLHPTWDRHNGSVDLSGRTARRDALGVNEDDVVLLTVGRIDRAERCKGHDRVLYALPSLLAWEPRIRYLIVGQGDDRDRLAALAQDLGVADRVTFTGFVDHVADAFVACDLYVMPSTQEGFGIVFLEALANGRPVVAGGLDGSIEAVCWGELGFLCDPLNLTSVEEAIRRVIKAIGGADPRVNVTFLRTQVEQRYGTAAFDKRLTALFGDGGIVGGGTRGAG